MKKEGSIGFFNSEDGKVNIMLFFSVILVFIFSMVFAEAMQVTLFTPGNFTFNSSDKSTRNITFIFSSNWSFGGADPRPTENVSNCSLFVNSTDAVIPYGVFGNATTDGTGNTTNIAGLINGSQAKSYIQFNFTKDGNYTYSIGCFNNTNSSSPSILTFATGNFSFFRCHVSKHFK